MISRVAILAAKVVAKKAIPTAKNYSPKVIKAVHNMWGMTAKEINRFRKSGIKVNEYYRSGPNPGQR